LLLLLFVLFCQVFIFVTLETRQKKVRKKKGREGGGRILSDIEIG